MSSKQMLNPKAIGIATAVITFILSILCLVIVFIFKESAYSFFDLFFHGIDLSKIETTPNIIRGILGSVFLAIIAFVCGWFFAIIYNKYSN
ncbi:MAG: DUF5676 family membrane protein [Nanoarchaeota archaeon]|nr:DUF5676 family membrane protein [Nanoarchaeota archaeon]